MILLLSFFSWTGQFLFAQTPNLIFEASFENTLVSAEGEEAAEGTGLSYASGIAGQGVLIESGDVLQYPVFNNLNASEGAMSLWVRPGWDPGGVLYRIMVLGNDPRNFELHMDEGSNLAFAINTSQVDGKPIEVATAYAGEWKKDFWYFLTYTWSSENLKIYVNGQLQGQVEVGFDIPAVADDNFHLGSLEGEQAFHGIMDELQIYDAPLSPEMVRSRYEDYIEAFSTANAISVFDIFERDVTSGISLVDWEGPVRNPAMKYFLKGTEELDYPVAVRLSSKEELASFSLPSTISKNGPEKSIEIASANDMVSFLFSVFMDENSDNETFDLELQYNFKGLPSKQIIPVHVIDQDTARPLSYPVIVDFSEARAPLMLDEQTQELIRQSAEHWLYYVDGEDIDVIPVGGSFLDIGGNDHLFEEKRVTNPVEYKGFYLYAYGNTNEGPCVCSTGFPNRELLQTSNGEVVPIFRIGGLHLNLLGQAYETVPTGWEVVSPFENWTQQDVIGTDMYMLAQHEIGHAMVFENSPLFLEAQERLGFTSPALTAYYPDEIVPLFPNSLSHVIAVLDPASQIPPYGGGVEVEVMPGGRAVITKLDILIMESVGYPIRDNGVTRPLSLEADGVLNGHLGTNFEIELQANGGIPVYNFEISEGVLPLGLVLDNHTGIVSGIPEESGGFPVTFLVRDYDERSIGATMEVSINISESYVGVEQEALSSKLKIYPNPTGGRFTVSMDSPETGRVDMKVFDMSGRQIRNMSADKTTEYWEKSMDLSGILPGKYILNVRISNTTDSYKLIIN
jgi:hypothetical protein